MRVSTVVVDDEPLARKRLRELLREHDDIDVVGEAAGGGDALPMIREHQPELLFLDVQMPDMDGFEVVRQLEARKRPLIVFATAFEQYALDAFRASAVQYLTKPVDRDELAFALARVRELAGKGGSYEPDAVAALIGEIRRNRSAAKRIVLKSPGRTLVVDVSRIDWVEAADNYVSVHIGTHAHLLRGTMAELERKLDPMHFVRVHRSTIVNLDRIREFQPASHGDAVVILLDGTSLTLSRAYRARVEALVGPL